MRESADVLWSAGGNAELGFRAGEASVARFVVIIDGCSRSRLLPIFTEPAAGSRRASVIPNDFLPSYSFAANARDYDDLSSGMAESKACGSFKAGADDCNADMACLRRRAWHRRCECVADGGESQYGPSGVGGNGQ